MTGMNLKNIVEAFGATAIVASLVFVGVELRQSQEIARTEIGMAVLAAEIEMNNNLMDRVDLWRRGSSGEELNDEDMAIFDLMVDSQQSFAYWSYTSFSRIGGGIRNETPIHNFSQTLHANPGLLKAYEARDSRYRRYRKFRGVPLESEGFNGKVAEVLEKYEAL